MRRKAKRSGKSESRRKAAASVLPIPQPSRPWDPALRPYLDACHAAYLNASALCDDAALLLKGKRYARATALAVTGLEEAGKALMLWFLGLGQIRATHREEVLKTVRWNHRLKQATSLPLLVIGQIIPLVRRIRFKLPRHVKPPRSWADMEQLLRQMLGGLARAVEPMVDEALKAEPAITEDAVQRVVRGSLETRRQQALYTDVVGARVQSPSTVRRAEAVELVRDLRACLRALKPLADITTFPDEGIAGVLASIEMHERLWATPSAPNADGTAVRK